MILLGVVGYVRGNTRAIWRADRAIHGGFDCAIAGAIWWDGWRGGKHRLCRCILGPRARSFAHFGLRKLTSAAISSGGDRQLHRAYVARDAAICVHLLLLRTGLSSDTHGWRPHCINRTDRFRCPSSRRAPWGRRLAPKNDDVSNYIALGSPVERSHHLRQRLTTSRTIRSFARQKRY